MNDQPVNVAAAAPMQPALKKSLGFTALTIYGLGNMLGAGIYALVGKAAGEMGNTLWMAFAASMVAAGLTGLSYASIGSRYPKAAGAAFVTERAFRWPMLAYIIGLVVMASGLTSMATTMHGFSGYFFEATGIADAPFSRGAVIVGLLASLTFINFWGLRESAWVNAVCTIIEAGGLLFIIAIGASYWGSVDYLDATSVKNPAGDLSAGLILTGAVLTFYSFIGFEDMLNVSEEVKNPRKVFPMALLSALLIATLIYMAVCITVVSVLPHAQLAASEAPLAAVVGEAAPWFKPWVFSVLALFAVTNTALLNYIMGSRLAYGMARQGLLPRFMGKLHPTRHTPHIAIYILGIITLIMAAVGNISHLANATSMLLLSAFCVVNGSLIVLQWRKGEAKGGFEVPTVVPAGGILICLAMLSSRAYGYIVDENYLPFILLGSTLALIFVLYFVLKPKHGAMDEETFVKDEEALS